MPPERFSRAVYVIIIVCYINVKNVIISPWRVQYNYLVYYAIPRGNIWYTTSAAETRDRYIIIDIRRSITVIITDI